MTMTDSNGQDKTYLTVEGLAKKLGISARTVHRWLADTDVPHRRAGGIIRFRFEEVDAWMKRGDSQPEPATIEGGGA
jgi:excisionase family DNA binding protein